MHTDKLVKLIKEVSYSHFQNRYEKSMKLSGRYIPERKLAEEDDAEKNGVDKTPNKIEINPVLKHTIVQSR